MELHAVASVPSAEAPWWRSKARNQIWHFAHEASQERPQCLPGSINLLRHLAISLLLAPDTMSLPECQHTMSLNRGYGALTGEAKWQLPIATIMGRNLDAPYAKSVAAMQPVDLPDCRIGLWVQIGDLAIDDNGFFEGVLIYHCGAPSKGTITTHASAIEYLQNNSRMYWQRMPDVYGVLRQAQEELKQRLDAQEAHNHPFQGERLRSLSSREPSCVNRYPLGGLRLLQSHQRRRRPTAPAGPSSSGKTGLFCVSNERRHGVLGRNGVSRP